MTTKTTALRLVRSEASNATMGADTIALERVASGDSRALGEVYERHVGALLRFATRTVGQSDAEDLVHATFVTAARIAKTYDGRGRDARAWLLGIMGRLVHQRRRAFARFTRMLFRAQPSESAEAAGTERSDIVRGLERLTESKRVVLLLAEVEGYTCEEIAEMLGIPVGTVWTRLHHARKELRGFYGEGNR